MDLAQKRPETSSLSFLYPLEPEDRDVYNAAADVISRRFTEGKHHVGAAVRDSSGKIYTAVHLQGVIGEPAVCAEKVAIGCARTENENLVDLSVAIRHPKPNEKNGRLLVLPPCGSCRELIGDYGGRNAWVILEVTHELFKARIADLLPLRRWTRGGSSPS